PAVRAARVQGLPRPVPRRPARRGAAAAGRPLRRAVPHLPRPPRQAAPGDSVGRGGRHVVEERLPDPEPHQPSAAVRPTGPGQARAARGARGSVRTLRPLPPGQATPPCPLSRTPSCAASIPTRRSCASATTTTSPPPL